MIFTAGFFLRQENSENQRSATRITRHSRIKTLLKVKRVSYQTFFHLWWKKALHYFCKAFITSVWQGPIQYYVKCWDYFIDMLWLLYVLLQNFDTQTATIFLSGYLPIERFWRTREEVSYLRNNFIYSKSFSWKCNPM